MTIDLIQIADELHGIPDSETKISVPCPVHGDLDATITLIAPEKLEAACVDGCETKELWRGLVKESATLARLWAEKKKKDGDANPAPRLSNPGNDNARAASVTAGGSANESQRKEESAYKGASGPGAEVKPRMDGMQSPPRPETQNGHVQGETKAEEIAHWKNRLGLLAYELLKADPEYHKANLTVEDIKAPLRQEIFASVQSSLCDVQFAVYKPPTWMGEDDQWAMIGNACEVAWDLFRQQNRNDLILLHSNGTVPKVVEPEPLKIDLPDLTKKTIEPLSWSKMRQRRAAKVREWVVSGKLARGETSSWSGKIEAGKTTLMRELALCVLRGEPFLGCDTEQGRVAYVMLDADGEDVTFDAFQEMGFSEEDGDNCMFIFEPMLAQIDFGFEQLIKVLVDFKPALVIVDPYPRLKMIEDFHSYTNTYLMAQLSHVAIMVNAHFALPGHIPRGRDDDADVASAGFGSISFSGGVNARFTVTNRNGTHTVRSSQGKGAGFQPFEAEQTLVQDPITKRIQLGGSWSWKDKARSYTGKVLEFLDAHAERCFDVIALSKEIRAQKSILRAAANMLYGEQKIERGGAGLKTDPYVFASLGYDGEMTLGASKNADS